MKGKGLLLVVVAIVGFIVFLKVAAPAIVQQQIQARGTEALGVPVHVEGVKLAFIQRSITITGLEVASPGGSFRERLLKVDRITANMAVLPLMGSELYVEHVEVVSPHINVERNEEGVLNLELVGSTTGRVEINEAQLGDAGGEWAIRVNQIEVTGGQVNFIDHTVSVPPVITSIEQLDLTIEHVIRPMPAGKMLTTFIGEGEIATERRGTLRFSGSANPFAKEPSFEGTLNVENIDILHFIPYLGPMPITVAKGYANVTSKVQCPDGVLYSTNRLELRDLDTRSAGALQHKALQPLSTAMGGILELTGENLDLDFVITGDLSNPNFNLAATVRKTLTGLLMKKLAVVPTAGLKALPLEGIGNLGEGTAEQIQELGATLTDVLKDFIGR